jgi:hypothetical protein
VVTFGAGGCRFGIEAGWIRGQSRTGTGTGEAGTGEAILGLAEPAEPPPRTLLRIGERLMAVTPPVELCRLEAAAIHPLPPLLAARTRLAPLCALALDAAGLILLIDGRRLLRDPAAGQAGPSD